MKHSRNSTHIKVTTAIVRSVWCGQVVVLIAGAALYAHPVHVARAATVDASEVFELTNKERARERIVPLERNVLLDRAAQLKADDMAEKGYYAHVSPEGRTPMYFVDRVGYAYSIIGENLVVQRTTAEQVLSAFMGSPGHRTNILRADFSEIGIGIADGGYKGKTTTFTVQIFAKPAVVVPVSQPAPPVQKPVSPPPAPVVIPEVPVLVTVPQGDVPMTLVPAPARDVPRVEEVPDPIETLREVVKPIIEAIAPTEQDSIFNTQNISGGDRAPAALPTDDIATTTEEAPSFEVGLEQITSLPRTTPTFIFVPSFIDAPVPVRMADVSRLDVGTPPLPVGSVWSQELRLLTTDIATRVRSVLHAIRTQLMR